jgi:dephospho-CoA kinase
MLQVGLTGGIACGKSTVTQLFFDLGVPIIDADIITRELMQPDTGIFRSIVSHFGDQILTLDKQLDRKKIANIIFSDSYQKQWLEALLHPEVRKTMHTAIKNLDEAPYCILAIPLLVETLPNPLVEKIIVVDCKPEIQKQRLKQRDNIATTQAEKIIQSQTDRETRLKYADYIIENNDNIDNLTITVDKVHALILASCQ